MDNSYHKLRNGRLNNTIEDTEEDVRVSTVGMGDCESGVMVGVISPEIKRVRLRAVESEKEFFFKLLNVNSIRRLVYIQAVFALVIVICQVMLYAIMSKSYSSKLIDITGIGIWVPIIFSIASGLSALALKSPTGCMLGTAMAFQIISSIFGSILVIFSTISLVHTGHYRSWGAEESVYDAEIPDKIYCSLIVLSAIGTVVSSIFISIQFCRATCCGRYKATEFVLFDVETVKQ